MPSLVGEIFVGIFLGPNLLDFVPFETSWVMLGEIGCVKNDSNSASFELRIVSHSAFPIA